MSQLLSHGEQAMSDRQIPQGADAGAVLHWMTDQPKPKWTAHDEWYLRNAEADLVHHRWALRVASEATTFHVSPMAIGQHQDLLKRAERRIAELTARKQA